MEFDTKEIGAKLRALRGNRSTYEVAEAVGISPSAVNMYELGERVPRDSIKVKLARYYGKKVSEIFFAEDAHLE